MKHKRLVIITTCLVFVMVCVLCLKELFSVKDITVVYSVTSNEVTEEVLSLLEKYKGESIFSIDDEKITEEITANRYLKVLSVEKKYPNELIINLQERTEKYYYEKAGEYFFFDEEYFIVRKSTDSPHEKEYLTEFIFENMDNSQNYYPMEIECELKSVFNFPDCFINDVAVITHNIEKVSSNVLKISFIQTPEEGNYFIYLQMKEGVLIQINKAGVRLEEKIKSGVDFYIDLEEDRKIAGLIKVMERDNDKNIHSVHSFVE